MQSSKTATLSFILIISFCAFCPALEVTLANSHFEYYTIVDSNTGEITLSLDPNHLILTIISPDPNNTGYIGAIGTLDFQVIGSDPNQYSIWDHNNLSLNIDSNGLIWLYLGPNIVGTFDFPLINLDPNFGFMVPPIDPNTLGVDITLISPVPELTGIEIVGANSVAEETQSVYQVIADYDDGSTKEVTADANIFVAPDDFAQIEIGGILETFRLYQPKESCTIYADYQGFAAEKPVTIYPLCDSNECTDQQLLERNIADVIQIKQDVMDDLDYAMKVERASLQLLGQQTFKNKFFKGWQCSNLNKARMKILSALIWETWASKKIDASIDSLEDAAELLLSEKPGNGPTGKCPKK